MAINFTEAAYEMHTSIPALLHRLSSVDRVPVHCNVSMVIRTIPHPVLECANFVCDNRKDHTGCYILLYNIRCRNNSTVHLLVAHEDEDVE